MERRERILENGMRLADAVEWTLTIILPEDRRRMFYIQYFVWENDENDDRRLVTNIFECRRFDAKKVTVSL
jgi:hypothetical protein